MGSNGLGTGAVLRYTGNGETTDRTIDLGTTTGAVSIEQAGSGLLKFSSDLTATGAGAKILTLKCSTSGVGEIGGSIVDNSVSTTTSVAKSGTGKWVLSGTNGYKT